MMVNTKVLAPNAKAAILFHVGPNDILFAKNIEKRLPIASITKLMTAAIVIEKIAAGITHWNDIVTISPKNTVRGSRIGVNAGEKLTVENLFKGMIIASGNDAALALAEHVSGTPKRFVLEMNLKARQLGLHNTHYVNPHGLTKKNFSSVGDILKMSIELIKKDEFLRFSRVKSDYITREGNTEIKLVNTNRLLDKISGVDGLKTGHTPSAGYCLCATAKRGSNRVISVVLGEPNRALRDQEVTEMLEYAFNII